MLFPLENSFLLNKSLHKLERIYKIEILFLFRFYSSLFNFRKATLAEDREDLRNIQERFYEDGDLLMEGLGRKRNYRWRNIDKPINDLIHSEESDLEDIGEVKLDSLRHSQKRVERLEREAFFEDQNVG